MKIEKWVRIKKREWSQERKKKESEVKRAFLANQPMILLVYKECYLNLDETNQSLPSLAIWEVNYLIY